MSEKGSSGGHSMLVKIALPLLAGLILGGWSSVTSDIKATNHEISTQGARISTLEERSQAEREDIKEIKADVKKLLERR